MCSWKLDFPGQVYTRRVILLSVAEYDAGNSSRTAPTSLSVTLACTPAYCDHILRQSFHTFSWQQCAEVLLPFMFNWFQSYLAFNVCGKLSACSVDKKCSSMDMSSDFAACRRKNINSSHGPGILFYPQLVEYMNSCGWPGPCPDKYQVLIC